MEWWFRFFLCESSRKSQWDLSEVEVFVAFVEPLAQTEKTRAFRTRIPGFTFHFRKGND